MTINTPQQLATRLQIDSATQMIALQTEGMVSFLRRYIVANGESRIMGRKADGKSCETLAETFERVTKEKLYPRRKK